MIELSSILELLKNKPFTMKANLSDSKAFLSDSMEDDVFSKGRGIFFIETTGLLLVRGSEAEKFLQGMISQNLFELKPGQRERASVLNAKAKLLFPIWVYRADGGFYIETQCASLPSLHEHLDQFLFSEDVQIQRLDQELTVLKLYLSQNANEMNSTMEEILLPFLSSETSRMAESCGGGQILTIVVSRDKVKALLERLLENGFFPLGQRAWDRTRVLRQDVVLPNEVTGDRILAEYPIQMKGVSYTKGCYVGQEPLSRMHHRGGEPPARLISFMASHSNLNAGVSLWAKGEEVGVLTTCASYPDLQKTYAMGFAKRKAWDEAISGHIKSEIVELSKLTIE